MPTYTATYYVCNDKVNPFFVESYQGRQTREFSAESDEAAKLQADEQKASLMWKGFRSSVRLEGIVKKIL